MQIRLVLTMSCQPALDVSTASRHETLNDGIIIASSGCDRKYAMIVFSC